MTRPADHVVVVTFVIKDGHQTSFRDAVIENARLSRAREPGCKVFDVCASSDHEIFLYEVYCSASDFQDHLASDHFRTFDETVGPWIASKSVVTYGRLSEGA
ncbi:putative quinol monooxygenase [Methylobacterium pseudosasicola]|uniref:Quinol monooxygenase YgiN n=1 Tax=Methylobacterium pseudosasicola TaxID=582667 RepID=A0A1I4PRI0_9HYPH|nr:putative quinol monooxygenase [Methylobacterium pseudosasicola]SFM30368.1 Quinol monooxygenase YgiN [Methylobacterium pseudosasicola]